MKYDFEARSKAAALYDETPSLTKQSFKDQCDMNNILKKYKRSGINPHVVTQEAKYGDWSDLPSYQDALQLVNDADDLFYSMPAKIRAEFQNDPQKLINFVSDPSNRDKAVSLGLVREVVSQGTPDVSTPPQASQVPLGGVVGGPASSST